MRALFWLIGLFSVAAGLSIAARYNEGYILLVLPPWRVEVSFNLAVLVTILAFVLVYLLVRLIVNTMAMPGQVQAFRQRKQKEKGVRALYTAVISLFEGRYGQAIKSAEAAKTAGEAPGLASLVAARAAHAMRDEPRFEYWLARAEEHDKEVRSARLMTQADLHCRSRNFPAATASLDALRRGGQRHIAALRLALKVHQDAGNWEEVLRLARQLEKHKAIGSEYAAILKARCHLEILKSLENDSAGILRYFESLPSVERKDSKLAALTARALIDGGDGVSAQRVVEQSLEAQWDPLLARLYAKCTGADVVARIAQAEKWLKSHPQESNLLLTLGKLCIEQKLWGKAQSYLEAALAVEPGRITHLELAYLFDQLGRSESANRHYRAAAEY